MYILGPATTTQKLGCKHTYIHPYIHNLFDIAG